MPWSGTLHDHKIPFLNNSRKSLNNALQLFYNIKLSVTSITVVLVFIPIVLIHTVVVLITTSVSCITCTKLRVSHAMTHATTMICLIWCLGLTFACWRISFSVLLIFPMAERGHLPDRSTRRTILPIPRCGATVSHPVRACIASRSGMRYYLHKMLS